MWKYDKRPKMHPMILGIGMEYEIKVGPLNTFKGKFVQSTKKGFNFLLPNWGYLLIRNIYPDKHCQRKGHYMVFWLPAKYVVVDESKIRVSDFTFKNYEQNWLKEENEN